MDKELQNLVNRTKLAAEHAEKSGFFETAQALLNIASMLGESSATSSMNSKLLQFRL